MNVPRLAAMMAPDTSDLKALQGWRCIASHEHAVSSGSAATGGGEVGQDPADQTGQDYGAGPQVD
jgi:hypothetical protein